MFGNLGEMTKMLQRLGSIKETMKQAQQEMAEAEYIGTSPDQRVKVVLSGDFQAKRVEIDPAAELTREALEPQVLAALENGMEQVRLAAKAKLKDVAGGMDIPGL